MLGKRRVLAISQADKRSIRKDAMTHVQPQQSAPPDGTKDGQGAGDHDQPYRFGLRPRAESPFPFNTRQYARLLVRRGRLRDENAEWIM